MTGQAEDPPVAGPSRGVRLLRGAATAVVLALPVLLLALAVREQFDPLIRFDTEAIRRATDLTRERGWADGLIRLQEITQPPKVYATATVVTLVVGWRAKLRGRASWAFVTMMVGWFIGFSSKLVVQRARPVVTDPISHAPGYSFPSGHALNITVASTAMLVLLWPLLRSTTARTVAVALGTLLVLAVGLDRVLLGVHFPSDVLAGWLLGGGTTVASWLGYRGLTHANSPSGRSSPE